jgi:hypothetical protein
VDVADLREEAEWKLVLPQLKMDFSAIWMAKHKRHQQEDRRSDLTKVRELRKDRPKGYV